MNDLLTKDFASDSNDEEYVPTKRELQQSTQENTTSANDANINKSKVDAIWQQLKRKCRTAPSTEQQPQQHDNSSIDIEIKNAVIKAKEIKDSHKVDKTYYFAGKKYTTKEQVTEKQFNKIKDKQTHKSLDNVIESISKKKNISTIDKSKIDWKAYVEKKQMEKELAVNRKDGFLGKKHFLDESNAVVEMKNKIAVKKAKYAFESKVAGNKKI
jgi:hypothetical protein